MKTKILYIISVIGFLTIGLIQAKEVIVKKETFNYPAKQNSTLSIKNQFGDIEIVNSTKDRIEVEVSVSLGSKKMRNEYYKQSVENIDIISTRKGSNIEIYTVLPRKLKSKGSFKVNYLVKTPDYVDMKLKNSFGNIIAGKMSANCKISVKFGSLIINELIAEKNTENTSEIALSFSKNSKVDEAQNIDLKLAHSECKINKAKILNVKSNFSELNVDEAEKLNINSKHDDIDIAKLNDICIDKGAFSDFSVKYLKDTIRANMNFSKLFIDDIHEDFKDINIIKRFGDVDISIDKDSKFFLDIKNEHGDVDLDHDFIVKWIYDSHEKKELKDLDIDHDFTETKVYGTHGILKKIIGKSCVDIDTSDNVTKIIIRSKHGDVKIDKTE